MSVGEEIMRWFPCVMFVAWLVVGTAAFGQQQDFSKIEVKGSKE